MPDQELMAPDDTPTPPDDTPTSPDLMPTSIAKIQAINPGYTEDGTENIDDFIELYVEKFTIAGLQVFYKEKLLYEFADNAVATGRHILLRYEKSPNAEESDGTYKQNLSMSDGNITLMKDGETLDSICWKRSETCENDHFNLARTKKTSLVYSDGVYENIASYTPNFGGLNFIELPDALDPQENLIPSPCEHLTITEIFSYYSESATEQFIEIYNPTKNSLDISTCQILYKKKFYPLVETALAANQYLIIKDIPLSKNPSKSNEISIASDQDTFATTSYHHGQKKSTSYALVGDEWVQTYAITPNAQNIYQEFRTCPEGKIINPDTGNCTNLPTLAALKPCAEGYERNAITNRCRKIKEITSTDYGIVPAQFSDHGNFIALGAFLVTIFIGLTYLTIQFRRELAHIVRILFGRANKKN